MVWNSVDKIQTNNCDKMAWNYNGRMLIKLEQGPDSRCKPFLLAQGLPYLKIRLTQDSLFFIVDIFYI